jgi:hypothetical protein
MIIAMCYQVELPSSTFYRSALAAAVTSLEFVHGGLFSPRRRAYDNADLPFASKDLLMSQNAQKTIATWYVDPDAEDRMSDGHAPI